MTLILTNDDGIDAPGIRALLKAVAEQKLIVAAPRNHLSGCGHQVTTTTAINVQQRSKCEYAIAGTPADCTRIALAHLCQDPTFVLSGINSGGNMGADVYISGTVAAVREAAFHGVPGIAISHYRQGKRKVDWDTAARWTKKVLADLMNRSLEVGTYWNVNLPHLEPGDPDPDVVFCQLSTQPLPVNYRVEGNDYYYVGEYAQRDRLIGTDVDVCFTGKIAVTQLKL
ncbi:MAG: 5'/3'-nucleotidase SurE [Chroococcus sp. CMT-3BRIN-NPC107]|jgi:5'-nucleotidase|nr:5'/3'-nucleotidase SurE [Chroococcus sp. CMT-3BRIN-NPC107]